jgi:Site-specific recombinase XerD
MDLKSKKEMGCFAFVSFMRSIICEKRVENKIKTAQNYETTLKSFIKFHETKTELRVITSLSLRQYESWLKTRGVSMNTISFYMRILRAVYNRAVYNRAVEEMIVVNQYPFKKVYTGIAKTNKRYVDEDVFLKLLNLDLHKRKSLIFARDIFLFSFYTRGMAFIDIAYLKRGNIINGYVCYNRHKTGQTLFIKIEPCISKIIRSYADNETKEGYLFPIIKGENYQSALRLQNLRLKKISEMLKLPQPLTSYVARHSWASIAKRKGIPTSIISEGMGHKNETITQIYLASFEQSVIDNANATLLKFIVK